MAEFRSGASKPAPARPSSVPTRAGARITPLGEKRHDASISGGPHGGARQRVPARRLAPGSRARPQAPGRSPGYAPGPKVYAGGTQIRCCSHPPAFPGALQRAYRNSKGFGAFNHRPCPVGIRKTGKFRPDFSLTILIASFIGKLQKVAPGATREIWNRPALEFHSIRVPGQLVYQANSRTGSITVPGQLAYRVN